MNQRDYRSILVRPETPLREAIRVMDTGAMGFLLVTDPEGLLLGTVTDGDVRRGLLRGLKLDDAIGGVMNKKPVTAEQGGSRQDLAAIMRQREIRIVPLLDGKRRVVGLEFLVPSDVPAKDNLVVILAGGVGKRLRPLTLDTPKPLVKVGGSPLLDVLIQQISTHGFRRFLVAVNHQAEKVEHYLGNGDRLGVEIRYIREQEPLGTVGAVRLAKKELSAPFLVVNGDILTKVNFNHLMSFHLENNYAATLAVKPYEVQLPYGVVRLSDGMVCSLEEKPRQSFSVNAGIYVLDPSMVELIPPSGPCDMPDLICAALERNLRVGGFPIQEYWVDIGSPTDYAQAQKGYDEHFKEKDPQR